MKAMVLAAGVGTRLDPLTSQVPKPLVPIANVPVMDHILRLLKKHGFTSVAANLHYQHDKIIKYFDEHPPEGMTLNLVYEEKLSGDAGGVRACRKFIGDERVLVVMGDMLSDADLTAMLKEHREKKALASIGVKKVFEVEHFGVVVRDENGFITGFQEKPKREEALSNLASTGIYILEPEVFEHIPKTGEYGFGKQLFPSLVKKGLPVLGIEVESYWCDVGTIDQYRVANFDALAGRVQLALPGKRSDGPNRGSTIWLQEGARLSPSARVSGLCMIGKNSVVKDGVTLFGQVVIGDNCVIEENATIANAVIWSGSTVKAQSRVEESVVGFNCVVNTTMNRVEVACS